ncbi:hypothetical protein, partial [Streptococcus pneumoniae]|uniref:hypothetical protein n=1 Tax=Streptococcus pneumoniae TaxID=1313 RepID=UPI0018B03F0A
DALQRDDNSREVVVLPPTTTGEPVQVPKLPTNLQTVETKVGTVIFDQTKTTPEEVQADAESGAIVQKQGIVDENSAETTVGIVAKDGK